MRLISGVLKGKPLPSPGSSTRPTSDRARQMLFNSLHHSFFWESGWRSLRVLDVFAGTGALGFEALSRGASNVTFIEKDPMALAGLEKTMTTLPSFLPKPILLKQSAFDIGDAPHSFDLIFLDPPYDQNVIIPVLSLLDKKKWMNANTLIVTETSREKHFHLPLPFQVEKIKNCGIARFTFVTRQQQ